MGFNTYSYIKLGPHYPFLATVHRPFYKFSRNNSVIPMAFVFYYLYQMIQFQRIEEFATKTELLMYSLGFISGILFFLLLSIFYFFPSYKAFKLGPTVDDDTTGKPISSALFKETDNWYESFQTEKEKLYLYLGRGFKIHQSRSISHIEKDAIERIFYKNRINASIFEILTILTFVLLGLFRDNPLFEIPAAMSIMLLFTIILMLFSAMVSWFGRWVYIIIFIIIYGMNYLSSHTEYFTYKSYAYGLNPEGPRPEYSVATIKASCTNDSIQKSDLQSYIQTLENWKEQTGKDKPKLVIINTSGGGSRSAMWTMVVLQNTDQILKGDLSRHLHLITGASGGMIGASYFRELMLEHSTGQISNLYNRTYTKNISMDMLNKLAFSASTNDIIFRYQSLKYNAYTYKKDRGHAFEEHLHQNTNYIMDHNLGYYKEFEKMAIIPTMIFSPTIVNDGRRLLVSSQGLSFMTKSPEGPNTMEPSFENIDYQNFFKDQQPNKIRFSSVLRANSTFPFVLPMVTLPTVPELQLMDAGIRDNYGGKTSILFLKSLKDWIAQNTSGIIILQIRDTEKIFHNETYGKVDLIDRLTLPFGNLYQNFPRTQDFDQEELLNLSTSDLGFPMDIISFNLRESTKDRISLSWHLTSQEKQKITKAYHSLSNQRSLERLRQLLEE